ncbi:MAG: PilZ domain-containing protein [Spirochaetes bacterium]|nr:PilZ domain-containing protein [Spirochaetota bacterium]
MNFNEKRKNKRYGISEYIKEDTYNDIGLEIKADKIYKSNIIDISINGLGYLIEVSGDSSDIDNIDKLDNFFISISLKKKVILTEVKKIWSIILEKPGKRVLAGGVIFSVISPEDRLAIANYINTIRS